MYIINSRVKDRLDNPLHLAGCFFNPNYCYRDEAPICMECVLACIEAFSPYDFEMQHVVSNIELYTYKAMEGTFSRKLAISGRMNNDDAFDLRIAF